MQARLALSENAITNSDPGKYNVEAACVNLPNTRRQSGDQSDQLKTDVSQSV